MKPYNKLDRRALRRDGSSAAKAYNETGAVMQKTRQTILNLLKQHGQVSIAQLSKMLDLTPVTLRHHLGILQRQGLVRAPEIKRQKAPGRPRHLFSLTAEGDERFPKNYAEFADLTLLQVRERAAPGEVEALMKAVAQRMADGAPPAAPGESLARRLDRVVGFLNRKGYAARWELNDRGYVLSTGNCPYQRLAQQHCEPCYMDLELLGELLGARPQRTAWSAAGDRECAYLISES
jgi:predicted ArsR family transcriptional regulator